MDKLCLPCCPIDEAESLRDVGVDAGDLLPTADAPGDDADLNVNVIAAQTVALGADEGSTAVT